MESYHCLKHIGYNNLIICRSKNCANPFNEVNKYKQLNFTVNNKNLNIKILVKKLPI